MSTGRKQFQIKFGADPMVRHYVKTKKHTDLGLYSEMEYYTPKNKKIIYWMLFPYVYNGTNYIWTEDKLTFSTFNQLTNFANELKFKLDVSD
jgi:hypothetical protein